MDGLIGNIVMAFLSAVLINNFVLSKFLGICPFLGVSKKTNTAMGMGAAVIFVMGIASIVTWLVQRFLLEPFGIEFLQIIAYILVIATVVQLVEMIIQKYSQPLYKALGVYIPLITTNCAVLGVCILNEQKDRGFFEAFLYGIFAGIGFTLALALFSGIRERLEVADIPESFKGVPVSMVSAAFVSLAFIGFKSLTNLNL